jgi:hypothetical protein
MAEGVKQYPRWVGGSPLRQGTSLPVIALQEVRRAYQDFWFRLAAIFVVAFSLVYLGNLYTRQQSIGDSVHTLKDFADFLGNLRWGALALAATMGGPALLGDSHKGALEIYLTRSVSHVEYLVAKTLAVFGVSFLGLAVPAVLYYGAAAFFFEKHPAGWTPIIFGGLLYAFIWGLLISGVALGLSCVARSSRAATIILFGGFALLEIVISRLLTGITRNTELSILSPFSAMTSQNSWILNVTTDTGFPAWWGLAEILLLTIAGWLLVAWRHPRVRGDERVRA